MLNMLEHKKYLFVSWIKQHFYKSFYSKSRIYLKRITNCNQRFSNSLTTANKKSVHKRFAKNVLLSVPIQIDSDIFAAHLIINKKNDLLADHISGQHVSSMLIIEAARQMMLYLIENFYNIKEYKAPYVIINHIVSQFDKFIFPWNTTIITKVFIIDQTKNHVKYEMQNEFKHNDMVCAKVNVTCSVFNKIHLMEAENNMANKSFNSFLQELK